TLFLVDKFDRNLVIPRIKDFVQLIDTLSQIISRRPFHRYCYAKNSFRNTVARYQRSRTLWKTHKLIIHRRYTAPIYAIYDKICASIFVRKPFDKINAVKYNRFRTFYQYVSSSLMAERIARPKRSLAEHLFR